MLQAAFVSGIGDVVRLNALDRHDAAVEHQMSAAAEDVYERLGGPSYCLLRDQIYFARESPMLIHASFSGTDGAAIEFQGEWADEFLEGREQELAILRFQFAPEAQAARRAVAERYWAEVHHRRIPDNFFADAAPDSPPARLSVICPPWWGLFVTCLQRVVDKTNPWTARILQELPRLRAEAARPGQKKVYIALVDEWREENAERFGLFKPMHVPMLEHRAFEKWRELEAWFVSRTGEPIHDPQRREEMQQALRQHLAGFVRSRPASYWNN